METRKLYYEDSHLKTFTATVLSCVEGKKGFEIVLDATAFYPEGGGQDGDTGILGGVRVLDAKERETSVVHICEAPLEVGAVVEGAIDWEARFVRMQQHSGEHIVSGILNRRYGCHNVGFHMSSDIITIDFDCVIPKEDLPSIEAEANAAVWADLPVTCWYPSEEELPNVPYRTKRALPWPVRIVEIPGVDSCACCGTHVQRTGEIGLIRLFSAVKFRNGTRMEMACGKIALEVLNRAYEQNRLVSQAFSAKPEETGIAAQRMNETLESYKYRITGLEKRIFASVAESYAGKENAVHFEEGLDNTAVRELADVLADKVTGFAAVFSGSDESGYAFCLVTRSGDLRAFCREMTAALNGRGGGKPNFQQGRVNGTRAEIEAYFA